MLYACLISVGFTDSNVSEETLSFQVDINEDAVDTDAPSVDFAAVFSTYIDIEDNGHATAHETRTRSKHGFAVINEARPPPDKQLFKIST